MNKALFLDRDGVINEEHNYVYKKKDFIFIEDIFSSCKYFQNLGFLIIVVTNQSGIARNIYTTKDFKDLSKWMILKFKERGVIISDIFSCPHHPDFSIEECNCRKPKPGLFLDAIEKYCIDVNESIMIGDKLSDLIASKEAGIAHNFLVETGHALYEQDKFLFFKNTSEIVKHHKNEISP